MSCIICTEESKYKCPTCRQYYCSVKCCQQHKETPCSAPLCAVNEPCITESTYEYDFPTEDTIPLDRLKLLEKSTELQKCLENPHLRSILEKLDKSPNPDEMLQEYMQEPIFTEFVDECLKVVQPQNDNIL